MSNVLVRRMLGTAIACALIASGCAASSGPGGPAPSPDGAAVETGTAVTASPTAAVAAAEIEIRQERYGEEASQFGELWLPSAVEPLPVVVLVHGGFWSDRFGRQLMDPLALDLASSGYAVWNIEYRRVGMDGGGWPTTFDDVAVAVDHLAVLAESTALDLERVAFVGHSAGGHLALWAAGREAIPSGETWSDPVVVPALAVGQAPVVDLATASIERAGGGAVDALLGGAPADVPERYAAATPDPGVSGEILIVLAAEDSIVLPRWTGGAPEFEAAQVVVPDADHFSVIDPSHPSWAVVTDAIGRVLGPPAAG